VHTLTTLTRETFTITVGGRPRSFADVLPDFSVSDRLALVVAEDGQSFDAAGTLLATVTEYYALLRQQESDFYTYPDFYAIHVGRIRAWHAHLDIWPQHKEVVVPTVGEALLTALNDRGITRVLLPPGSLAGGAVLRESLDRLRRQTVTVLEYGGGPAAPIELSGGPEATTLIRKAVAASPAAPEPVRRRWATTSECGDGLERTVERLTPVDPGQLAARLLGLVEDRTSYGLTEDYRSLHGVTGLVLERHLARIR
jgi:hypothetical protein